MGSKIKGGGKTTRAVRARTRPRYRPPVTTAAEPTRPAAAGPPVTPAQAAPIPAATGAQAAHNLGLDSLGTPTAGTTSGNGASPQRARGTITGDQLGLVDLNRNYVREAVDEMFRDGSMVRGLTRALETESQREAKRKHYAEQEQAKMHRTVTPATPPKPPLRYAEFLDALDVELERVMALVSGLDERTAFLQFNGPETSGGDANASGQGVGHGPSNALEAAIYERVNRLAIIRTRLEHLHAALRI